MKIIAPENVPQEWLDFQCRHGGRAIVSAGRTLDGLIFDGLPPNGWNFLRRGPRGAAMPWRRSALGGKIAREIDALPVLPVKEFWDFVRVAAPDDCWLWTGVTTKAGYGRYRHDGANRPAHQWALIFSGRPRPKGAMALHSCDNPPCCNPGHLRWGTARQNVRDMYDRARNSSKLSQDAVRAIYTDPRPHRQIADDHGITRRHVRAIKAKKAWSWLHDPDRFMADMMPGKGFR